MQKHAILAPSKRDADRLTWVLTRHGYHARTADYGTRHVVLALAPLHVVNAACRVTSFTPGLPQ